MKHFKSGIKLITVVIGILLAIEIKNSKKFQ